MGDKKIEVFIVFDQRDSSYLEELKDQLQPLVNQGLITIWDATQIRGGENREQRITDHLRTASIILLLASASLFASATGYQLIKRCVAKSAPPEVYVVPILLHDFYWEGSDISVLTPLPTNGKSVSSWSDRNAAYLNIVKDIRKIITEQQQAFAEKAGVVSVSEVEEVIVDTEDLEYDDEDQPWFASKFPKTIGIDQEQIDVLKNEIDVVIMTATDKELDAVMHLVGYYPGRKSILQAFVGTETYFLGKFGMYKAAITMCFSGSVGEGSSALATSRAINTWSPRAVIMAGIAFGKDPAKQKIADVMVASQIIPYERVRVSKQEVVFRAPIPPSNATLLNRFRNARTWHFTRPDGKECALLIDPLLSGEKLVDNLAFKRQLFQVHPQAIGGEMEGAGVCSAAGSVGVPWILVKSICDWGDGKKHKRYQTLAAAASASLVHHVLSQNGVLNGI